MLVPACTKFLGCFADVGFVAVGTCDLVHNPHFFFSLLFVLGVDEDLSEVDVRSQTTEVSSKPYRKT